MSEPVYPYEVALSFAGEEREYVEKVAGVLSSSGVSFFYDRLEENNLWGQDLTVHLDRVFREQARYSVVFVSASYATKVWPRREFGSALARAVQEKGPYILPVRFDDTDLPGLLPTIGYLDARRLSPLEVGEQILSKLGRVRPEQAQQEPKPGAPFILPKVTPVDFNPYAEAERSYGFLKQELARRTEALPSLGVVAHVSERDGRFRIRVLKAGDTIYTFDMWLGGLWGDGSISFHHGWHANVSPNATTATGSVVWDAERGSVVQLTNFSLLPSMGDYKLTSAELADRIWAEAVKIIEQVVNR